MRDVSQSRSTVGLPPRRGDSLGGVLSRGVVALAMLTSGVVFTEPAPVDLLMLAAMVALVAFGDIRITRGLAMFAGIMLIPLAAAFLAVLNAIDMAAAARHTAVTLFLFACTITMAAFVMAAPERHLRLILKTYTIAAVLAAVLGIAGYLGLFPGAAELFTKFDRAAGTFKDPNVFGPFLVAPFVYLLACLVDPAHRWKLVIAAAAAVLALGVLLSVSRGAWMCLALAVVLFAILQFLTAGTEREKLRIIVATALVVLGTMLVIMIALQFDAVSNLINHRASLTNDYDVGPEGRFGGQQKAKALIIENPFGLGSQQFGVYFHIEEAHNVYLTKFLNAGWLGGFLYLLIVLATVAYGFAHALRRNATTPLFQAIYATFVGHAVLGYVIDLDHWRHFNLLLGLVWAIMLVRGEAPASRIVPQHQPVLSFERRARVISRPPYMAS